MQTHNAVLFFALAVGCLTARTSLARQKERTLDEIKTEALKPDERVHPVFRALQCFRQDHG